MDYSPLPPSLSALAKQRVARLEELAPHILDQLDAEHTPLLHRALALSDFIDKQLQRHPQWLVQMLTGDQLFNAALEQGMAGRLAADLAEVGTEEQLNKALRLYRNYYQVMIAWRDLCGLGTVEDSLRHISTLAETLITGARDWLYESMQPMWGTPVCAEGRPQPLLILGMGKLGGGELNFSSDIDLIFTFPEHGQTRGGRRSTDNQPFFIKLAQKLINALDKYSYDGFVYRVDMRLRPFGASGPLVMSFAALEDYYQSQGRDWERYAMVKARILGEQNDYTEELRELLRPFVFRRYIDFSAIESLRQMKQMISHEVRRRGLVDNIKLGSGGIREVEFIAQTFQLIRGGREPKLRQTSLLATLASLGEGQVLDAAAGVELREGYLYLRQLEHYLQQFDDQQTQTLPDNDIDWARLLWLTAHDDEAAFRAELDRHIGAIHQQFLAVIGEEPEGDGEDDAVQQQLQSLQLLFQPHPESFDGAPVLAELGCVSPESLWQELEALKQELDRRAIGPRGREMLLRLLPQLALALLPLDDAGQVVERLGKLLSTIATRTAYIELLAENPGALQQLIKLCRASSWIAEHLTRYPILLDELLDPKLLYHPLALEEYGADLRQYLLRIPEDDLEQMMEGLRQYKQAHQLRIAAADITGVLPLMKVSDHLSYLAGAIVEVAVQLAWDQMVARYGEPEHDGEGKGFAVVGYGKLGGLELGYGSDLDLVFLHCGRKGSVTGGKKAIDSGHFYLKMAQRILHLFNTRTNAGILYEVDMRLRPSGNSGLLVSPVAVFGDYQRQEAWTWEHQALIRARLISGDPYLGEQFAAIRKEIICRHREPAALKEEVAKMRAKMRDHLSDGNSERFDLKQDPGGIADIEFIAQYLVLAHGEAHGALARWSDNVRIFETLEQSGVITAAEAQQLTRAYCHYRNEGHRQVLQGAKSQVDAEMFVDERRQVTALWQQWLSLE